MKHQDGIQVWLDARSYRAFRSFDQFVRLRSIRRPLIFLSIFAALALISFAMGATGTKGGWLLGAALLVVGILLPASYVLQFLRGVDQQAAKLGLTGSARKYAYTLLLYEDPEALTVQTGSDGSLRFPWTKIHGIWRGKEAIYLYVAPEKAYILPQLSEGWSLDEHWRALEARVPDTLMHGRKA